jgi:WD repeat-containing protein 68
MVGISGEGLRIYRCYEHNSTTELVAKLIPAQLKGHAEKGSSITSDNGSNDNNLVSPAPITSFDWNRLDPTLLVTSSYDTTCAVWNLKVKHFVLLQFRRDFVLIKIFRRLQ